MRIIRDFVPSPENCGSASVVTLGTFDGVHEGHRRILDRVVRKAEEHGVQSVVVTFDRHPAEVVGRDSAPRMLTTLEEKLELFSESGVSTAAVLRFTEQVAAMSAEAFIREYLLGCLGMRFFVVGYDHGFGKNRDLSSMELPEYAREHGFELEVVPPVMVEGMTVKSSTIRIMLEKGDVRGAALLLGREYSLGGVVAHGKGNGRKIGIPTANLAGVYPGKIIPSPGVYAGWAEFDHTRRPGVISVGPRPTFQISEEAIEIHIPGFNGDLYDRPIRIGFAERLRDIRPFDSREALVKQIQLDIEALQQFTFHKK